MHTEGHLRTVFRESGFRRLLATRLISQISDGFFQAGLASSILFNPNNRTNAISIALGFTLLLIPYSVLGPYVGVFLDRWSRRNILFKANILRAVLVIPTAVFIATDKQWFYGAGALLVIAVNRFVLSGLSASQPHVVAPANLVTANSIAPTLGTVAYTVGLGVAASMRLLIGNSTADNGIISAIAIVGYLIAGLIARSAFTVDALGPDASARRHDKSIGAEIISITRGMAEGARHLWSRRGAAYMLITQGVYRALYGVLTIALLQLFRVYFDAGEEDKLAIAALAAVVVVGSAGGFLGALITPYLTRRFGPRTWVIVILVIVAVDIAVFGPPFIQPLLIAATFFLNIGSQSLKIVVDTSIQLRMEDNYRGRVFSVNDTFFNVSWVLGQLVGAMLLPEDGHSLTMIIAVACGFLLLAGGYALASRRHTPYDRPSWTTN